MENKPNNEENEGKKNVFTGLMIFIISFLVTLSVLALLVCWWIKTYTPPEPRMKSEKKVVARKNVVTQKSNSTPHKVALPKKEVVKAPDLEREVLIPSSQVIKEKKVVQVVSTDREPVINVSGDIRNEFPNIRAVPSEAVAKEERVVSTRVVVVEAPPRQDRFGYVYGAFGNNNGCGWWNNNCGGWNGGSGIYCNSFGTGLWPCPQQQNNFVNQPFEVHHHHRHRGHHPHHVPPPPVPPPVVVPPPSPPPHHHHGAPVSPAPSGGPVNPAGF